MDLKERLERRSAFARRVANEFFDGARPLDSDPLDELCEAAIARIEALEAENAKLRSDLEIANYTIGLNIKARGGTATGET